MAHFVYIIFSPSLNSFYIGECENLEARLQQHLSRFFADAYTKRANDWELFHSIECIDRIHARLIEKHIKNMKSKTYLHNLKTYPEISEKLINRFGSQSR